MCQHRARSQPVTKGLTADAATERLFEDLTMTRKLKIAVVGAGRLGGFHAQKLAAHPQVELIGVVDPVAAQRDRVAAQCGCAAVANLDSLPEPIDAAVVAAPTRLHHRIGMELLTRNVHVLMEKPICAGVSEAEELVAEARRRGLVLQVGHVERFNPALDATLPDLEEPKYIETVRASGFTFRSTDVGVVLDLMIHDIDLVLSLVRSPVVRVEAMGVSVLGGHEDIANARLEFGCGCVAQLSASRVSYEPARRMHAWTPRSFVGIDFGARAASLVRPSETLLERQFDVESLSPDEVEHLKTHLTEEHLPREVIEREAVDALALETADFVDAVLTGRAPRVTGEDGRDALAVAARVLASIDAHAWDGVPEGRVGPRLAPTPAIVPVPPVSLPMRRSA